MKKGIFICLVLVMSIGLFVGCSADVSSADAGEGEQTTIRIVVPKSPGAIPVIRMMESSCMGNTQIDIQYYTDMEKMMAIAMSGEYEMLILPVHTAANLYNKEIGVNISAAFTWGGLSLCTTDPQCNGWEDLKGKELYVPAKGSVPDMVTQYFLSKNGLTIGDDLTIVYSNHTEIAQLIAQGTIQYAVDAQPYVTMNKKNVDGYKVIADFVEEWKLVEGEEYKMPGFCVVVKQEYGQENKQTIKTFNEKLNEAIEWTKDNPEEAGTLAENYIGAEQQVIADAMSGFNFDYYSAVDAKEDIENYYKVLYEINPQSIGGALPNEGFYYIEE